MTAQRDVIAERLRALSAGGRPKQGDLEELRLSTESALNRQLAALDEIRAQTYRGAAGSESDDDRVIAEIDSKGSLLSVEISPYAMKDMDADAIALACTEAIAAARGALAAAFQERFPGFAEIDLETNPLVTDAAEVLRQAKEMRWGP